MKRLIFLPILLLISVQFCFADQITIHFKGKIYNDKNAFIGGATVQVVQDAFLTSSTQTDADGNYNLYLPLNREFDVTISKSGYVQKKYFISTKGIDEHETRKFPTYVADVFLFTHYSGIDYSLFDQPINKYSYNPKNHNMDFDEAYLKTMKIAMKEIKKAEREYIKLTNQKEIDQLNKTVVKTYNKNIPQEVTTSDKALNSSKETIESPIQNLKVVTDIKILALLAKYKPGVTEEVIEGNGTYIIQRVLVRDSDVWIYQKKIFNWGGIACFRDDISITESVFEQETKK